MASITSDYIIRPMSSTDMPAVHELSQKIGWEGTRQAWEADYEFAQKSTFVVTHDNQIIGVALGLPFGKAAGIASVIIDSRYQGKGLGKRLVGHLSSHLQKQGFETITLEASTAGYPVYEKLGFQSQDQKIIALSKKVVQQAHQSTSAQEISPADLDQIEMLDGKAFGTSRRYYIDLAAKVNRIFISKDKDRVAGFLICSEEENKGVRIGPWFHENPQGAEDLLNTAVEALSASEKQYAKIALHVPKANATALAILGKMGFEPMFESIHMELGSLQHRDLSSYHSIWSLARG